MIKVHSTAWVSNLADIEDSKKETNIIIGENVIIDSFVKIKPAGGVADVIIDTGCVLNSGCVLYTGNGITFGENVAVAANCTFAPTNHEYQSRDITINKQGFMPSKGGIKIGNDVWIGANSVILDGSIIEDGCVIGAGSIVRGRLESYGVYVGNPLTKISQRK